MSILGGRNNQEYPNRNVSGEELVTRLILRRVNKVQIQVDSSHISMPEQPTICMCSLYEMQKHPLSALHIHTGQ